MANWNVLKAAIAAVIRTNGNNEITGQLLQDSLSSIISNLGENATYKGIATTTTAPGTPDGILFYLAANAGTYANFNGYVHDGTEVVVLSNATGNWVGTKTGIATRFNQLALDDNKISKTIGLNKADPKDFVLGKFITLNGTIGTNASWGITGYIPFSQTDANMISNYYATGGGYNALYDANRNFIASFQGNLATWQPGVAYVRYSSNSLPTENVMVNVGSVLGTVTPFTAMADKITTESIKDSAITTDKVQDGAITTDKVQDGAITGDKLESDYKDLLDVYFVKKSDNSTLYVERASAGSITYPSSEGCAWAMAYECTSNHSVNGFIGKPTKTLGQVWAVLLSLPDDLDTKPTIPQVIVEIDVTEKWNANIGLETEFYFGDQNLISGKNYGFGFRTTGANIGYYGSSLITGINDARPRIYSTTGTVWGYASDSTNIPFAVPGQFDIVDKKGVKVGDSYITESKLADNTVAEEKIQNGAVTESKLAVNAISNTKVQDGAITETKTDFFDQSKNLFDPNSPDFLRGKFLNSTGSVVSNASYSVTGYIPISDGQNLICNKSSSGGGSYSQQYDANKVYIPNSAQRNIVTGVSGCAFVRFSLNVSDSADIAAAQVQVENGTVSTEYVPYGFVLKEKYVPQIPTLFENQIAVSSKLYMLSGVQNDIFVEALIKRWRPYNDIVRFSGTSTYQRRLHRVASISAPVDGNTVQMDLINLDAFRTIMSKVATIVLGTQGTDTGNIYVSIIGDSVTNGAFFADALLAQSYVPNIHLIGLRDVPGYAGQFDEGRGGWTLAQYFVVTNGRTQAYNGFWQPDGVYNYWGSTAFWKLANDIRLNPSGGWTFNESYNAGRFATQSLLFDETTGYKLAPSANDVMYDNDLGYYVEYDGANWNQVAYGDYTWNFNYGKYLTMWGFTAPSILFEFLGLNDFRGASDPENIDFATWNTRIETVVASYLAAVPTGKFVLLTPSSTCGSIDNTAGDFTIKQNAAMWSHRKNIIDNFDGREAEQIYVVDTGISIDNMEGYTYTTDTSYTKPYSEYAGTEKIRVQTGNPHPHPNYPNMGVALAAFIQKYR